MEELDLLLENIKKSETVEFYIHPVYIDKDGIEHKSYDLYRDEDFVYFTIPNEYCHHLNKYLYDFIIPQANRVLYYMYDSKDIIINNSVIIDEFKYKKPLNDRIKTITIRYKIDLKKLEYDRNIHTNLEKFNDLLNKYKIDKYDISKIKNESDLYSFLYSSYNLDVSYKKNGEFIYNIACLENDHIVLNVCYPLFKIKDIKSLNHFLNKNGLFVHKIEIYDSNSKVLKYITNLIELIKIIKRKEFMTDLNVHLYKIKIYIR